MKKSQELVKLMLMIAGPVTVKRSIYGPLEQQGLLDHTWGPGSAGAGGMCPADWKKGLMHPHSGIKVLIISVPWVSFFWQLGGYTP